MIDLIRIHKLNIAEPIPEKFLEIPIMQRFYFATLIEILSEYLSNLNQLTLSSLPGSSVLSKQIIFKLFQEFFKWNEDQRST